MRDIERFLAREGLPEEIKQKKKEELKLLHRSLKDKKEAQKFELKYKKVKFIEKRKVIRHIESIDKELKQEPAN